MVTCGSFCEGKILTLLIPSCSTPPQPVPLLLSPFHCFTACSSPPQHARLHPSPFQPPTVCSYRPPHSHLPISLPTKRSSHQTHQAPIYRAPHPILTPSHPQRLGWGKLTLEPEHLLDRVADALLQMGAKCMRSGIRTHQTRTKSTRTEPMTVRRGARFCNVLSPPRRLPEIRVSCWRQMTGPNRLTRDPNTL